VNDRGKLRIPFFGSPRSLTKIHDGHPGAAPIQISSSPAIAAELLTQTRLTQT